MARRLPFSSSWLWLTGALILVAAITLLTQRASAHPRPLAADSAAPDGALALRLWLDRLGYDVSVVQADPNLGGRGTLMVLASGSDAPPVEARTYLRWVADGGRLIIAVDGATGTRLLQALNIPLVAGGGSDLAVRQPVLLAPPVARLAGDAPLTALTSDGWVDVVDTSGGPALSMSHRGKGEVWLLTATDTLDNAHLGRAQNRRLLLDLAGSRRQPVILDEFIPTTPSVSTAYWLVGTAWGAAILFAITLAVLYRWLAGWRLGPPIVPLGDRYRTAAEYVVSLAGLLQRGRSRREVLAIYQRGLQRSIRRRFGSLDDTPPGIIEARDLQRLLGPRDRLSEEELVRTAGAIVREEEIVRHGRF
jgi:hypothetical protein